MTTFRAITRPVSTFAVWSRVAISEMGAVKTTHAVRNHQHVVTQPLREQLLT